MSQCASHELERIELWKQRSGLDFLGAVRSRKVVACMIDNVSDGAAVVFVDFLGRTTAVPAGLFAIAAKCDAPVLPVHVNWHAKTDRFRVVFGPAVLTDSTETLDVRTAVGAQAVANYFSEVVGRNPGDWESWRTLEYRWPTEPAHRGAT